MLREVIESRAYIVLFTTPFIVLPSALTDAAEVDSQNSQTGIVQRSGGVAVTVADTGRGMSREELDRAFDDFHTTKPDGTGLGLSVVRRLVADVGGTLRVETAPGSGTRFFVELPTAPGAAT